MNYNETKGYIQQIFGDDVTKEQVPEKVSVATDKIKEAEGLSKDLKDAAIETLAGIQKSIRFGAKSNKPSKVLQRRSEEAFKFMTLYCTEKEENSELAKLFKGLSMGSFEENQGRRKW